MRLDKKKCRKCDQVGHNACTCSISLKMNSSQMEEGQNRSQAVIDEQVENISQFIFESKER